MIWNSQFYKSTLLGHIFDLLSIIWVKFIRFCHFSERGFSLISSHTFESIKLSISFSFVKF